MSDHAAALGTFVAHNPEASFLYFAYVGWPYLAVAFAIGSIPFGVIVSRTFFKSDIRDAGSRNIGAANALRTFGPGAGVTVLVLDAAKGAAAVLLAKGLVLLPFSPPLVPPGFIAGDMRAAYAFGIAPLCALCAVLAHCYSPWLRFRGGKGVATYLGALAALGPKSAAIFVVVWLAVAFVSRFASAASIAAATAVAAFVVANNASVPEGDGPIVAALGILAVIVWRHRENLARLRAGTEPVLSLVRRGSEAR